MRPDDLLQMLHRQPFYPLRLTLTTGIVHEIRHPELLMVGRSTLTMVLPGPSFPVPLAEETIIVALLHVVQIERIHQAPSPSNN